MLMTELVNQFFAVFSKRFSSYIVYGSRGLPLFFSHPNSLYVYISNEVLIVVCVSTYDH